MTLEQLLHRHRFGTDPELPEISNSGSMLLLSVMPANLLLKEAPVGMVHQMVGVSITPMGRQMGIRSGMEMPLLTTPPRLISP